MQIAALLVLGAILATATAIVVPAVYNTGYYGGAYPYAYSAPYVSSYSTYGAYPSVYSAYGAYPAAYGAYGYGGYLLKK